MRAAHAQESGQLPTPPDRFPEFPAATGFFPYGEYNRGSVKGTPGGGEGLFRRQLRAYRRCYINTYIVTEYRTHKSFRKNRNVFVLEEARKRRMRIISKAQMLRRFEVERGKDGRRIELPAEPATREAILARLQQGGKTLDVRREFAEAYGDLILAYDFSDEPQERHIPNYMMLQNVYREIDPDHPVLAILNLNRTAYLPYMPIYYGDEYPIRTPKSGGRNPWAVTKMVRFCATRTDAPVWVMLQAFGRPPGTGTWQLPDEAEMRLTIYETVANGAKGITFHGSSSYPCWRWSGYYYFETTRDSWGAEAPSWRAMREAGRHITAIGPALLNTKVSDAVVLNVTCETVTVENGTITYRGPAIKAGVLQQRDGDGFFAVVVNQDVKQSRQGTLTVNTEAVPPGSMLYDLYELSGTGLPPAVPHELELRPGDGRIFFLGTKKAARAVLSAVHKGHYDNELPLYEMDLEAAVANGCDVAKPAKFAVNAAKAYQAAEFAAAHAEITAARKALAQTVARNPALAKAQKALSEAQAMLSEVVLTYRRHFDVVVPPDLRKATPKYTVYSNTRDPKMQTYVDDTAEAMCLRMELEDQVWAGKAAEVSKRVAQLRQTAHRLKSEAIQYVLKKAEEN